MVHYGVDPMVLWYYYGDLWLSYGKKNIVDHRITKGYHSYIGMYYGFDGLAYVLPYVLPYGLS